MLCFSKTCSWASLFARCDLCSITTCIPTVGGMLHSPGDAVRASTPLPSYKPTPICQSKHSPDLHLDMYPADCGADLDHGRPHDMCPSPWHDWAGPAPGGPDYGPAAQIQCGPAQGYCRCVAALVCLCNAGLPSPCITIGFKIVNACSVKCKHCVPAMHFARL